MSKTLLIITVSILLLFGFWQIAQAAGTIVKDYPDIPGATKPSPTTDLPGIINYIYRFALGAVGIVALIVMLIGALSYVFSAGNASKMADAKDQITSAILGVIILLASVLILRTINPDLVKFNLTLPEIKPMKGCCYYCCNQGDPPCAPFEGKSKEYSTLLEANTKCKDWAKQDLTNCSSLQGPTQSGIPLGPRYIVADGPCNKGCCFVCLYNEGEEPCDAFKGGHKDYPTFGEASTNCESWAAQQTVGPGLKNNHAAVNMSCSEWSGEGGQSCWCCCITGGPSCDPLTTGSCIEDYSDQLSHNAHCMEACNNKCEETLGLDGVSKVKPSLCP